MALVGPNCYGFLNYLDGAALWPDQHGGRRVERGAAIVLQSGNIALNLTMQTRGLPIAYLITVGNKAKGDIADYVDALRSTTTASPQSACMSKVSTTSRRLRARGGARARERQADRRDQDGPLFGPAPL